MTFSSQEHDAVLRLLNESTGFLPECRSIAHWLQRWDQAHDKRTTPQTAPGTSSSQARDVFTVASAARRDNAGPRDLGRPEYAYRLQFVARAHPLPQDLER